MTNLNVNIDSLTLSNPVLVASGTFGYAREMAGLIDLSRLGGIVPKTVTLAPRAGNPPLRTAETSAGLLNSIGLDNDGIDEFLSGKMPYLRTLGSPIILSVAAKSVEECPLFADKINSDCDGIAAVELNISCPNVSGGIDFATEPTLCERIVTTMKERLTLPLFVKLSPNVTSIAQIALAAERGGADAICATNTCLGMAIDWRRQTPRLGNAYGGLSGPAIKPIALRCVHQIYNSVKIPIIGIGGISNEDDMMEFFVAGASAIQIGTANFFDPAITMRLIDALPKLLTELGAKSVAEIVGSCKIGNR
jgi:dihydroorotate dehydrogenase (NAD+) catalytic subunit